MAQPVKLNEHDTDIARLYAERGMSISDIAAHLRISYSTVAKTLKKPKVLNAIRAHRERLFATELPRIAINTLVSIMQDSDASPAVRFQASRYVLETSGYGPQKHSEREQLDASKPLTEMNLSELQAFISAGTQALQSLHRPKLVNPAAASTVDGTCRRINAQDSAQDTDQDDLM